jgi:broad specificity phosphatase PhoE
MKKTLYIMRHGQTLFNSLGKIQGWSDSPLTEEGIKQAQNAGQYFKDNNITFSATYSSTSERASDTLEIVTDFSMPYTRLKELKERNFGVYEAESEHLHPELKALDTHYIQFGGESYKDVSDRMVPKVIEIMEEEGNDTVLIVSHGVANFAFLDAVAKVLPEHMAAQTNCGIIRYSYENGVFTPEEVIAPNVVPV